MNTDIVMNNNTNEATATPTPSVAVKVIKGDEMRRFNFEGKSFQEIKNTIAEIFGMVDTEFTLQYEDDEKDRVTLSSDAELKEAIQLHKYVLRFYVVTKPAAGDNAPLPIFPPHRPPHHHHHHHRREHPHPPPPHHGHHDEVVVVEGQVPPPPPHHGHGPYGRPLCPAGYGRHHGHGPHGHKRRLDKEDKEAMKAEKKRWKKYRKCESSSSSEDEAHKLQKKEMRQLMKATKQSIKANWAPVKEANPAQWPENRAAMIAEIKMAKRIIREQANKSTTPVAAVTEQNTPVVTAGAEMQA